MRIFHQFRILKLTPSAYQKPQMTLQTPPSPPPPPPKKQTNKQNNNGASLSFEHTIEKAAARQVLLKILSNVRVQERQALP